MKILNKYAISLAIANKFFNRTEVSLASTFDLFDIHMLSRVYIIIKTHQY